MEKQIIIKELRNGFECVIKGYSRNAGEYVFKTTEELKMFEFIGDTVLDPVKVKVERR